MLVTAGHLVTAMEKGVYAGEINPQRAFDAPAQLRLHLESTPSDGSALRAGRGRGGSCAHPRAPAGVCGRAGDTAALFLQSWLPALTQVIAKS